jgi:hypothetical protein
VIYGIEKNHYTNVTFMTTCSKNYGIVLNEVFSIHTSNNKDMYLDPVTNNVMAQQQLTWLIRRGDLLLSDAKKETTKQFLHNFAETDERKFRVPIYEYPDDDDELPDRFRTGKNGV